MAIIELMRWSTSITMTLTKNEWNQISSVYLPQYRPSEVKNKKCLFTSIQEFSPVVVFKIQKRETIVLRTKNALFYYLYKTPPEKKQKCFLLSCFLVSKEKKHPFYEETKQIIVLIIKNVCYNLPLLLRFTGSQTAKMRYCNVSHYYKSFVLTYFCTFDGSFIVNRHSHI